MNEENKSEDYAVSENSVEDKLKKELELCQNQSQEYLQGWQRSKADYLNYRKDEARRFEDMAGFVTASMIHDVLPVLDSFDLALQNMPSDGNNSDERGVLLIRSQLLDVFKKRGLEEITAREGDVFSTEIHESIAEVQMEGEEGTIAEQVQKGYRLKGKVIRPARVKIIK